MKIIYVANFRIPTEKAHGLQVMNMCAAFARCSMPVDLIVPHRSNPISEDPFVYYNIPDSIKDRMTIERIWCLDLTTRNIGGRIGYWIQTLSFLYMAQRYVRRITEERTETSDILMYTRELATGLFFGKYVLEIHDIPGTVTWFHKRMFRKASHIVVLTTGLKRELVKQGIDENKIHVAPDGVDLDRFSSRSKTDLRTTLGLPLDKKIAMYVGSFYTHRWKGIDIALQAAAHFDPGIDLVCVGATEADISSIRERYPASNIHVIGRQRYYRIPEYIQAADLLLLPNTKGNANSELYTSPLKLFEYMASGVPIIASDLPSIREVLDTFNAILVEPGEPLVLARAVNDAVARYELAEVKANKALRDVIKYTWKERARAIIEFVS